MKFKVLGTNKDTGARMVLEFEAESRAAAERKAIQSGMVVTKVQDIQDGETDADRRAAAREAHRGEQIEKSKLPVLITLLIVLVIVAAVIYVVWPKIQAIMSAK